MQLFFTHSYSDREAHFDQEESAHLVQSLRKRSGDEIHFTDGKGHLYSGLLLSADKRAAIASIERSSYVEKSPYVCKLFIAATKQMERLEWVVEKAVEMGVPFIGICVTERCERSKVRMDRLERIALSAMKQSLQYHLPTCLLFTKWEDALHAGEGSLMIATCSDELLPHFSVSLSAHQSVSIYIGPEGDFSPKEIEHAMQMGCTKISLGKQRLRTETAALYAASVFKTINQI